MSFKTFLKSKLHPKIWYFLKEKLNSGVDEILIAKEFFAKEKMGVMIDVGACYGTSFLPFSLQGWEVFAFEPDTDNYNQLSDYLNKWNLSDNITVSTNAVSNKTETLKFYKNPESVGISSLNNFHQKHYFSHEVATTTLDIFTKENQISKIDFLKIDTEGYDLFVLKGLDLESIKPKFILCEFEDKKTENLGYTVNDMVNYLQDHGYNVVISLWKPIAKYGESHHWDKFTTNLEDISKGAWGNLLAVGKDDFKHLKKIIKFRD